MPDEMSLTAEQIYRYNRDGFQAYTLHVINASASYPKENWLQRSAEMPLRGF
jgi:hypothetical protein